MAEAPIVHDLPDDLAMIIGKIIAAHSRLEHTLTQIPTILLGLNKAEARIALREPRAGERLEMALDIFAIKGIEPTGVDLVALRTKIDKSTTERDQLAHGIWLRDSEGQLYLRLARSNWPKDGTGRGTMKRAISPQSMPYGIKDALELLALIEDSLASVNQLGEILNQAMHAFPDRFRSPAPLVNPSGRRMPKKQQVPPKPFRGKYQRN